MSELPPPPAPYNPPSSPTQAVGQQMAPTSAVPMGTPGSMVTAAPGQMNNLAIVSFVTALVAPFGHIVGVGGITLIIISIVTGHMARSQIRKTGEAGAGFALAGLIISYVHLAVTAILLIFFFGLIIAIIGGLIGASH
ncbi:MAG TPA: DUF4190 domain-containing protein [Candidatus Dormibacteraeota bacterium]|nr:DUF4190 domain-containing protein [Candidatus Dormibacteraeota bacterium]